MSPRRQVSHPRRHHRVLNGHPQVRPETRRKQVEEAISLLGYVRNRAPWGDHQRQTGSVAFVVCEDGPRLFADPYLRRGSCPAPAAR